MATFPRLKTGAVAQYPLTRWSRVQNQILHFLDGTDQRYRDSAGQRLEWEIQLSQLDPGEVADIERFFGEMQGAYGSFSFTDPWDGQVHDNCSVADDVLQTMTWAELLGTTRLTIVRNV